MQNDLDGKADVQQLKMEILSPLHITMDYGLSPLQKAQASGLGHHMYTIATPISFDRH